MVPCNVYIGPNITCFCDDSKQNCVYSLYERNRKKESIKVPVFFNLEHFSASPLIKMVSSCNWILVIVQVEWCKCMHDTNGTRFAVESTSFAGLLILAVVAVNIFGTG